MKEVNLGDYVKGSDFAQNRIDFLAALAACKGQRAHALYVPDPNPSVLYQMKLLASDKPTSAQIAAGEPGDNTIARFLVDWDLEIYGDGTEHSVLSMGCDVAGQQFSALKMMFPYSLTLRGVRIASLTTMASVTSPMTFGVYVPPKTGNPTTENRIRTEKAKVDGFGMAVGVTAGPVHAANRTSVELFDSEFRGQLVTVGVWNDPDDDGQKNLHLERCKLFNTDKHSGWGSHLMYIHENVSWRAINSHFYDWASAKFAIQNWGTNPNYSAKYSESIGCHYDKSGDGPAIITSDTGPCQVSGGQIECRQGIEVRQKAVITDVLFKPQPTIAGTIACISTYDNAEVVARDLVMDMSEIGDNLAQCFAIGNNNSKWDIDGARISAKKRTASLLIYGSSPNITHGHSSVHARHVTANGYHVPDVDFAAGIRSVICLVSGYQGNWKLEDQYIDGDMVSDRGALRFDGATNVLQSMDLERVECVPTRGLGMYSTLTTSGKVTARRCKMHNSRMQLVGGAFQHFKFDEVKAPVGVAPVTTRNSTDWLSRYVLPIGTDYNVVVVTGDPAAPIIDLNDVCVNLIRKTMTKPAVLANPSATPPVLAEPAHTYTDVYSSEDTDNFVDAELTMVGEIPFKWRGVEVAVGQLVKLVRRMGVWIGA